MRSRLLSIALGLALSFAATAQEASPPAPTAPALEIPPSLELVAETPRFRLRALPGARALAEGLSRTAETDRTAMEAEFGRDWDGVTEVWVVPDSKGYEAVLPEGVRAPEWARGLAFPRWNLVLLRPPADRSTFRHELSHIAVGRLSAQPVPRWFLEGLATIHAGDVWNRKGPSLVRAALSDGLFSFESLTDRFPSRPSDVDLAYAQSADFVQFLADRHGEEALREVLQQLIDGEPFEVAIIRVMGATPRVLENEWRRSMARWELAVRSLTSPGMWWGLLSVLFVLAWFRLRRRRTLQLRLMELQERAEALAAQEAMLLERARELETAGRELEAGFEEPFEEPAFDEPPPGSPAPKKPTLH